MSDYSFKKTAPLRWREHGVWHESHIAKVTGTKLQLSRKYPNANFKIKKVALIDINYIDGAVYGLDDTGVNVTIFATFSNEADEAEFIMKESCNE
jgi:hypothetical protein